MAGIARVEVEAHDYSYAFRFYREPMADPDDGVVIRCNDASESSLQSEDEIVGGRPPPRFSQTSQYTLPTPRDDTPIVRTRDIHATSESPR